MNQSTRPQSTFFHQVLFVTVPAVLAVSGVRAEDWTPLWTTATLSQARYSLAATTVGNEVFFAGGRSANGGYSNMVDIYNTTTGVWSTASLSVGRTDLAATSVGNLAIFGGGYTGGGTPNSTVDIYNTSTGVWSTTSLTQDRWALAAASAGSQAVFAGGFTDNLAHSNVVDIYNGNTGTWSTATLSQPRSALAAASVGNQIFFGGGDADNNESNVVDIYNTSTDKWSTAALSQARDSVAATTVGNLVLFGGGETLPPGANSGVPSNVVDIYNTSTGTWSTATLSVARNTLAAASVGNLAFFAGGGVSTGAYTNTVDIYNSTTGVWSTAALSQPRIELTSAICSNQVFFAGGQTGGIGGSGPPSNVVDIYTLQSYSSITSSKPWTLVDQTTVAGQMQLNSPGSLSLGSYSLNVGSMSGNVPIDLGSGTLTTGSDNTNTTFSGNISDAGTLVKTGSGTLVLADSNSYSGGTTINAGTLMAGAANTLSPNSAVTINGGMLDVTAGSQTVASLTMGSSGALNLGIGNGNCQLVLSGSAILGGTLDVELLNGFTPQPGEMFDLFSGSLSGTFNQINLPQLENGSSWDTSNLYSTGEISVVPEPSTFALLGTGAICLVTYGLRRRGVMSRQTRLPGVSEQQDNDPPILAFPSCSSNQANAARRAA